MGFFFLPLSFTLVRFALVRWLGAGIMTRCTNATRCDAMWVYVSLSAPFSMPLSFHLFEISTVRMDKCICIPFTAQHTTHSKSHKIVGFMYVFVSYSFCVDGRTWARIVCTRGHFFYHFNFITILIANNDLKNIKKLL